MPQLSRHNTQLEFRSCIHIQSIGNMEYEKGNYQATIEASTLLQLLLAVEGNGDQLNQRG